MMLSASAGGNRVPVIAQLVAADEDTVRDVMHRCNEIGPDCLAPWWAGGRPRLLSDDDEGFVVQPATTRPSKPGQPFTRWSLRRLVWSLRRLVAHLRTVHGRVTRIGREALRGLLARRRCRAHAGRAQAGRAQADLRRPARPRRRAQGTRPHAK